MTASENAPWRRMDEDDHRKYLMWYRNKEWRDYGLNSFNAKPILHYGLPLKYESVDAWYGNMSNVIDGLYHRYFKCINNKISKFYCLSNDIVDLMVAYVGDKGKCLYLKRGEIKYLFIKCKQGELRQSKKTKRKGHTKSQRSSGFDCEFLQIYLDKGSELHLHHDVKCPCKRSGNLALNISCYGTIMMNKWSKMEGSANIYCNTFVNWGREEWFMHLENQMYYDGIKIHYDNIYRRP